MKALLTVAFAMGLMVALATDLHAAEDDKKREWTVEDVRIEGNEVFDDGEVKQLMVTRPAGWFRSNKYRPDLFENDLNNVIDFYRSNGYLDARVVDTQVVRDTSEYAVSVTLTVDEGPLTVIESISLFGNTVVDDSTILALVPLVPGSPYDRRKLQEGLIAVASYYADRGYLEASVVPRTRINETVHRVLIDFVVDEGTRSYISDILIDGLKKTQSFVVRRELSFKTGEPVSHSEIMASQRRLYLLGLFNSVYIEPVQRESDSTGQRTIVVDVNEKYNTLFSVSAGFGAEEKVKGRSELSVNNLAGTARQAGIILEANFVERRAEAAFTEPRTIGTRLQTDFSLYFSYQDAPGFDVSRYGGLLTVGRKYGERGNIMVRFRYENQQLRHIETDQPPDNLDPRIRSFTVGYTHDSRDNLFNATRGWFTEISYELAGAFLNATDAFSRAKLGVRFFHPLRPRTILASSVEFGWMDVFGESGSIPVQELFFTGGSNTIRAFEFQRVGPSDITGVPTGGQLLFVGNFEVRQAVWKWFGVVGFFDIGNVWTKTRFYRFDSLRYAVGGGIRGSTPIGIARVDFGYNVAAREGEDSYQLFISMGQAF